MRRAPALEHLDMQSPSPARSAPCTRSGAAEASCSAAAGRHRNTGPVAGLRAHLQAANLLGPGLGQPGDQRAAGAGLDQLLGAPQALGRRVGLDPDQVRSSMPAWCRPGRCGVLGGPTTTTLAAGGDDAAAAPARASATRAPTAADSGPRSDGLAGPAAAGQFGVQRRKTAGRRPGRPARQGRCRARGPARPQAATRPAGSAGRGICDAVSEARGRHPSSSPAHDRTADIESSYCMGIQYCTSLAALPRGRSECRCQERRSRDEVPFRTLARAAPKETVSVCYSAQVQADYKKYVTMFGAEMSIREFYESSIAAGSTPKIKIPKAVEAAFAEPADRRRARDQGADRRVQRRAGREVRARAVQAAQAPGRCRAHAADQADQDGAPKSQRIATDKIECSDGQACATCGAPSCSIATRASSRARTRR